MKKLNKKQVKEIKKSKKSVPELAKEYNVTTPAIHYHKSEEVKSKTIIRNRERYRNLTKEQKKELLDKKREYQREYHKNRYTNDPKFREKQIDKSKKYQKENYQKKVKALEN